MDCDDVGALLDAYIDAELPEALSNEVDKHLDDCSACFLKAAALRRLAAYLNDMPEIKLPPALAIRTLKAFRADIEKPGITDWWRSISVYMRGAVCGIALAGLVFGIILGGSFSSPSKFVQDSYLTALYHTEGVLP